MNSNILIKVKFYIISLIVLFALSIIVDFKIFDSNESMMRFVDIVVNNWFSVICFLFIVLGIVFLLFQNHEFKGATNPCYEIQKIGNSNYEFLTFISTYIIPMICINFDNTRYKIVFFILLTIIGVVFVKMNLYLANPILALMGYKLYTINTENREGISIISKDKLSTGDSIDWIELDDTCWYVRRRKNGYSRDQIESQ